MELLDYNTSHLYGNLPPFFLNQILRSCEYEIVEDRKAFLELGQADIG